MGVAVLRAALRAAQVAVGILRDLVENDGQALAKIAVGAVSIFVALLMMVIMPVVIHERIPVATTKEQAVWYWQAAKSITEMTQSPCDPGVYVDWQQVVAIDAVRLKQNFKKSSPERALELAARFVEEDGTCTH